MDTRKLEVAPKVGQLNIVQGDEIVARVHESDRRDYAEAQDYADEMVRRWNAYPALVDALESLELRATQAHIASRIGRPKLKDADFLRAELERMRNEARALLATLKA